MIKSIEMLMSAIWLIIAGTVLLQCGPAVYATDMKMSVGCWNRFCEIKYLRTYSRGEVASTRTKGCMRPEQTCSVDANKYLGCRDAETPPPPDIYCVSSSSRVCRCAHDYTIREKSDEGVAYCDCSDVDPEKVPKTLWQDENKVKDLIITPIVVIAVLALLVAFAKVCVSLLKVSWNIYSAFQSRKKDQMNAGSKNQLKSEETTDV